MCLNNWIFLLIGFILGLGLSKLIQGLNSEKNSESKNSHHKNSEQENLSDIGKDLSPNQIPENNQPDYTELAYQMAHEMSLFKGGFLARVTHELRSPLNGLIGLHQLILEGLCESPSEEQEFISQAHERALLLLKLLDGILKVARADYGTNKLDIQPVPLSKLFQEVQELTKMLAANRNFPFKVMSPQPEIYVLADKSWLRQVLTNLISTTITRMEEGMICLSAANSPSENKVYLWLDIPHHAFLDQEPIELISSTKEQHQVEYISEHISKGKNIVIDEKDREISPGMKLLLNQTLVETMGGKLEVISHNNNTQESTSLTRIQISIPPVTPEVEFLAAESEI